MALIRTGGDTKPSKIAVVSFAPNTDAINAIYDNGSGETVTGTVNLTSNPWGASDLVSVSYDGTNFTITFKRNCKVIGMYGNTSITGDHVANTSISISKSVIFAAYVYA